MRLIAVEFSESRNDGLSEHRRSEDSISGLKEEIRPEVSVFFKQKVLILVTLGKCLFFGF